MNGQGAAMLVALDLDGHLEHALHVFDKVAHFDRLARLTLRLFRFFGGGGGVISISHLVVFLSLLGLSVHGLLLAESAVLHHLEPVGVVLLILVSVIIASLAF